VLPDGGTHFRVWAPLCKSVTIQMESAEVPLISEPNGYFSGVAESAKAGTKYRFRLDEKEAYPDPASRYQPEGPHGPSQVVDPSAYVWKDRTWKGVDLHGQVIYELHVGTFTREGSWKAATEQLHHLAATGITVIEIMPVAEFSGKFGWGYDGVNWFAPSHLYGTPDDMRRFVDAAHAHGIAVILDVVYNHFGPDGNYSGHYSGDYVTQKHKTDWGDSINYDGPNSGPVRDFVESNASYWIDEFHLDGLRLDATQDIYDDTADHILAVITAAVRSAAGDRKTIVVGENEPQDVRLIRPIEEGGFGLDGLWNDDFHHTTLVALTGRNEAYYTDYQGKPQEFISSMKYGFLYQGQWYSWQKQRRGTPALHVPKHSFVTFIENHDQVANSARGLRLHQLTSPGLYRVAAAMNLLGPGTPMLFQGAEFAASAPFHFFADMPDELADRVREGRKEFLKQWRSMRNKSMLDHLQDPCSAQTFEACKIDQSERDEHDEIYRLYCDLIRLKRHDPILSALPLGALDGAVLSSHAFVVRYFGPEEDDRLLVVNLGVDLHLDPAPEPLLAPPQGRSWTTMLSTEWPKYGGSGSIEVDAEELNWLIAGNAATLLEPGPLRSSTHKKRRVHTSE
jgi:maltooligosyltrehalose trehalohydrolase